MLKNNLMVAGVDIGTSKTCVCLGGLDPLGRVEIHNTAMVKTRGMEKGIITNLGEVCKCVEESVKKAQEKTLAKHAGDRLKAGNGHEPAKINSVYVTVSGEHILGNNTKGMLQLAARPVEITYQEVNKVIASTRSLFTAVDREILHTLTQYFTVDGNKKIKDPLGIYGSRLGVNLHVISAGASYVDSLLKAVNRSGLDVDGFIYAGLASSLAVISEQEKQSGVIFLEFGCGTVNVMFFNEGNLQYINVIPLGGYDITAQISQALSIDFAQAEQLKMHYRSVGVFLNSDNEAGEDKIIIRKNSANYENVSRQDLIRIIDSKLDEIIADIKKELELAGLLPKANCGVVISGGMSFMEGIMEKLEGELRLPVKLGIMRGFVSHVQGLSSGFYAASIGTVIYALQLQKKNYKDTSGKRGFLSEMANKFKSVYEEYF